MGDETRPVVGIVGGSRSDFPVLEKAVAVLDGLGVPCELRVVSAHRTPDHLFRYAETARDRGIRVIVAGAGGAAHLPGMLAAKTSLPVIGVPIPTQHLGGLDSLLSIVQMPRGIPVATVAIGNADNAALLAAAILALSDEDARRRAWRRTAPRRRHGVLATIRRTRSRSPADRCRRRRRRIAARLGADGRRALGAGDARAGPPGGAGPRGDLGPAVPAGIARPARPASGASRRAACRRRPRRRSSATSCSSRRRRSSWARSRSRPSRWAPGSAARSSRRASSSRLRCCCSRPRTRPCGSGAPPGPGCRWTADAPCSA